MRVLDTVFKMQTYALTGNPCYFGIDYFSVGLRLVLRVESSYGIVNHLIVLIKFLYFEITFGHIISSL